MYLKNIIFFLLIFFVSGCSYYLAIGNRNQVKYVKESDKKEVLECSNLEDAPLDRQTHKELYFSYSQNTIELFQNLLKRQNKELSFIDKVLYWSLAQAATRPDSSDPHSRFTFLLFYNGKHYSYDFKNRKKHNNGFREGLYFINSILYDKNHFHHVVRTANSIFPKKITLNSKLSSFLESNPSYLSFDQKFSAKFFRNGERLITGETFPRESLNSFIPKKKSSFPPPMKLEAQSPSLSCNFDMQQYQTSLYNVDPIPPLSSNFFAIEDAKGNSFMAITENEIGPKGTKIQSETVPSICFNKRDSSFYYSFHSRDSRQVLYHLKESLEKSEHNSKEMIEFSRYIYLKKPERIIYESERGTNTQLTNLYSANIPLYHVDSIGEVWATQADSHKSHLIQDSRSKIKLFCR